jgi:hypothetical protein
MNIEEAIKKLKEFNKIKINSYAMQFVNISYPDLQESIETLLSAYEKEKEKNSKAIAHIEACKTSLGNYILSPNETEYLLSILKEE